MKLPTFLPLLCLFGTTHAAELRTWTDVQNRKIEATMTRIEGTSIIVQSADGRELPLPLAKLSPADQKYVEDNRALTPIGKLVPALEKAVKPAVGAATAAVAKALNFDAAWPDRIQFQGDPEVNVVEENVETKSFIYESANYRYICDARLGKTVVKGFAVMFETTLLYCRTLPIAFDGGTKTDGKFKVRLFEEKADYIKAGGPSSSAGVFLGAEDTILVPLESIGVKPLGSSYMLDREKSSSTIPHELTHQLSPECYFKEGAQGWFSEGIAEYIGNTPYRAGLYNVRSNQKPLLEYVTGDGAKNQGGRVLGKKINMPPLKGFMLQSYAKYQETGQLSYGCSLLLTNYFLHVDGEGDGKRIKAFLKALRAGKKGEEAIAVLLDGRTYEQLQKDFSKALGRQGIDITFGEG